MVAARAESKDVESESHFQPSDGLHHALPAARGSSGSFFSRWTLGFTDPLQRRHYRSFCQEDTNIPLIVFVGILTLAAFVTRYNVAEFWTLNPTMVLSFVVGVIAVIAGTAATASRLALWAPIASYPLQPGGVWYRVRTGLQVRPSLNRRTLPRLACETHPGTPTPPSPPPQSVHDSEIAWTVVNDLLMLASPTACSLNALARYFSRRNPNPNPYPIPIPSATAHSTQRPCEVL